MAIGTVWTTGTWEDTAWAADTWADAVAPWGDVKVRGVELVDGDYHYIIGQINAGIDTLNDIDTSTSSPTVSQILEWNGSQWVPAHSQARVQAITNVTNTYQILTTDETISCNKATAFTVTLPVASIGRIFKIKNIGAGIVTVEGTNTDTIDDELNQAVNQWDCMEVECFSANEWGIT